MNDRMFDRITWSMIAGIVATIVALCITLIVQHGERQLRAEQRSQWYALHGCHPVGYVGSKYAERVYRCNDGIDYIWEDIPVHVEAKP